LFSIFDPTSAAKAFPAKVIRTAAVASIIVLRIGRSPRFPAPSAFQQPKASGAKASGGQGRFDGRLRELRTGGLRQRKFRLDRCRI